MPLLKASKSSSPLDHIPISLLHEITESLTIPLNNIFYESLESSTFPTSYKHALITPFLKKPNFYHQSLNNYRPISNLSIFFKTLERIVAKQLTSYLISHKNGITILALLDLSSECEIIIPNDSHTPSYIYRYQWYCTQMVILILNQPNFLNFSSLNSLIFTSCNTRCSPWVSHWTNTL